MEKQLSNRIKIVEDGNRAAIVYVDPDGTQKNLMFDNAGVYINTSNTILTTAAASDGSSTLMPLSYSSQFQTATLTGSLMPLAYSSKFATATLSNTFQQTGLLAFANIGGFSWTSTVNGASTTMALKTA
jgi:hypothetical protein